MEGCLSVTIRSLNNFSQKEVVKILKAETDKLEITKSLLNILYNICIQRSVRLSQRQKTEFRHHVNTVQRLLDGANRGKNRTTDIVGKRNILIRNPELCQLIASTCPTRKLGV